MAPKKASRISFLELHLSHPEAPFQDLGRTSHDASQYSKVTTGLHPPLDMNVVHKSFRISNYITLEMSRPYQGAVVLEGFTEKVVLYPMMFLNWLWLPFYHYIQDVLDFIGLASSQLHPNAWRILIFCCVVWHRVLHYGGEEYPNLTLGSFSIPTK